MVVVSLEGGYPPGTLCQEVMQERAANGSWMNKVISSKPSGSADGPAVQSRLKDRGMPTGKYRSRSTIIMQGDWEGRLLIIYDSQGRSSGMVGHHCK